MSDQPYEMMLVGLLEYEANGHGVTDYKHKVVALIRRQHSRIEELENELMEQCRINGMGAERELAKIARIEADEALMPMLLDALESCDPGDFSTGHVIHASYNESLVEAAITALRKRLESSK